MLVNISVLVTKSCDNSVVHGLADVITRNLPAKRITLANGEEAWVATVFDLMCANYSLDRGLGGEHVAKEYDEDVPFTPAWAEKITGVRQDKIIQVAREFADNAEKTEGRSKIGRAHD